MIVLDDLFLMTLDEVAEAFDMPRYRVEVLLRNDELAGVMLGGRWMVSVEEANDFLAHYRAPVITYRPSRTKRFRPVDRPAAEQMAG